MGLVRASHDNRAPAPFASLTPSQPAVSLKGSVGGSVEPGKSQYWRALAGPARRPLNVNRQPVLELTLGSEERVGS